jgi:tryptophanyl-tRNA synthetase
MEVIISESKQVKEKLISALKAELEEIRKKRERAVGADAYNYYWEKEKKLEDMISSVSLLPNT